MNREMLFVGMQHICKFAELGCDRDRKLEITCRNKHNIPLGHSWGECNIQKCPLIDDFVNIITEV